MGQRYHTHRKALMLSLWLGLTDIYNLLHARDLSPARVASVSKKSEEQTDRGYQGLIELRQLQRELDRAVRDAYGWHNLDLGYGFHEVETLPEDDRVRYTISPAARKEVLRELLALNQERAADQEAIVKAAKKKAKARPIAPKKKAEHLFVKPDLATVSAGAWARPMQDHRAETGVQLAHGSKRWMGLCQSVK